MALRLVMLLALFSLAACSAEAERTDGERTDDEGTDGEQTEVLQGDAFCAQAGEFVGSLGTLNGSFDADSFEAVDTELNELIEVSPVELLSAASDVRDGYRSIAEVAGRYAYDLGDPALATDLASMDRAVLAGSFSELNAAIDDECGVSADSVLVAGQNGGPGEVADGSDPDVVIDQIAEVFGVDRALAECLYGEFGDIVNADSTSITPEVLTREACGTSLFNLLNGVGSG